MNSEGFYNLYCICLFIRVLLAGDFVAQLRQRLEPLTAQYLKTGMGIDRLCPNLDVPPQGPEQAPNFRDLWCGVLWRSSANNKPEANSTYTSSTTLLLRFEIGGALVVLK